MGIFIVEPSCSKRALVTVHLIYSLAPERGLTFLFSLLTEMFKNSFIPSFLRYFSLKLYYKRLAMDQRSLRRNCQLRPSNGVYNVDRTGEWSRVQWFSVLCLYKVVSIIHRFRNFCCFKRMALYSLLQPPFIYLGPIYRTYRTYYE